MSTPMLSRRAVLRLGAAAAGAVAISGCSTGGGTTGGGSAGRAAAPTFRAHPGLAGIAGAIEPSTPLGPVAYTQYPQPFTSVARTPGSGGQITAAQLIWGTPPPGGANNSYGQAISKALGVDYRPTFTAAGNYQQKIATMLAGGELPDLSWLRPGDSAATGTALSQGAFADLGQVLGGDAVLEYPNLANIPAEAWKRSMFRGKVLGVPRPLWLMNNFPVWRADWVEKAGFSTSPKSPDEMFEIQKALSSDGRWAYGNLDPIGNSARHFVHSMFGVPNGWTVDKDGNFKAFLETEEFEAALDYLCRSWKAGHFHPDALLNQTQGTTILELFNRGRSAIMSTAVLGYYAAVTGGLDLIRAIDPAARTAPLVAPGNDGKPPVFYQTEGWYGMASISAKAAKNEDRLRELLRVLDYLAAPFGSKEYTLINFGVEGRHFTFDAKGDPVPTKDAQVISELAGNYFIQPGEVSLYLPGAADRVKPAQDLVCAMLKTSVADASTGLYSQTLVEKSATLAELNNASHSDIVSGRKPLAEGLKEWRQSWASRGGDKVREELEASKAEG